MKLYYVANARMPSEKAHGIQIAKMCEALIKQGAELELIVPDRGPHESVQDFYGLACPVPVTRLPVLDLYAFERIGYAITSVLFMVRAVRYLRARARAGESFAVYTVDIDSFSGTLLRLAGQPYFSELHGGKLRTLRNRFLFKRMQGAIAINSRIKREMEERFGWDSARAVVEPNGVDLAAFGEAPTRAEARRALGLPQDRFIVLYTGRFIEWKGLEILPKAAHLTPDRVEWIVVGGTEEEFKNITGSDALPPALRVLGGRPYQEMPLWQAAADALLVLGTARSPYSFLYTAPMKIFEYAASRRSIIAADTPALREHLSSAEALFYRPDDAADLARAVEASLEKPVATRVEAAYATAVAHSWDARATRVLAFMRARLASPRL